MEIIIQLYGRGGTRSARCRWTLNELELPFEYIDYQDINSTSGWRELHPLGKTPVAIVNRDILFESSAICSYFCDLVPDKSMISAAGTINRARHEQWISFGQSELESYLWVNYKHTQRNGNHTKEVGDLETNVESLNAGLSVLEREIKKSNYFVGGRFSVTDIVLGWTINWARRTGYLGKYPFLDSYLDRLFERPHCTLNP